MMWQWLNSYFLTQSNGLFMEMLLLEQPSTIKADVFSLVPLFRLYCLFDADLKSEGAKLFKQVWWLL